MPPMEPKLMPGMAQGGLSAAAQQLQGQGRDGDSMLVHMTPGEVRGLQGLAMAHGGSLTINPTTGLPEAGILKSLLPTILGAGAMMIPGLQGVGAGWIAAGIGGLTTLATGSLKKGLMAGLGAWGGANLAQGLGLAGTPENLATAPTTVAEGSPVLSKPAPAGLEAALQPKPIPGITSTYGADSMMGMQGNVPPAQLGGGMLGGAGPTPAQVIAPGTSPSSMLAAPPVPTVSSATPVMADTAVSTAITPPTPTPPMSTKDLLKYGGAALAPALTAEPPKGTASPESYLRPYEFAWNQQEGAFTPSPRPGDTSERRYFTPTFTPLPIVRAASGGEVNPEDEMTQDGGYAAGGETGIGALAKRRKSLSGDPYYKFSQDRRDSSMEASIDQNFAAGGLPPRFLSGGGDGMSDSIRARIDGKQEARLADGEFVVPADVVSHLGNGSSKAGAKKLYAMMDKIRKARTGKERQAPAVRAEKYMPA